MLQALEKMLAGGTDNALLRFGLGKGYLDAGQAEEAVAHLKQCVTQDSEYSAAWKLLGKAYLALEDKTCAAEAWQAGIACALRKGDKQAEKEMKVFLNKLAKG